MRFRASFVLRRIMVSCVCLVVFISSASAQSSAEKLYADLSKLKPDQREKRLEEGARKEGKLNFVHTWRGKLAKSHIAVFEKRYPYLKVEMSDLGSQDAAERFIAEERVGRHLTDALSWQFPILPFFCGIIYPLSIQPLQRQRSLTSTTDFSIRKIVGRLGIGASTEFLTTSIWLARTTHPKLGSICVSPLSKDRFPLIQPRRVSSPGFTS
jgi:hypothetical protein